MNIITNEPLIRRNARIGQVAMFAGLLVLAGGAFLSFGKTEQFSLSVVALVLGFILSQIGIYFMNRWGRKPRPDELLNQALKGLDGKYTLFHYNTPAAHLLLGPSGVWVIMPRHQAGTITYTKGRWRQRGGNLYMKIFAQDGLGRPDLELGSEIEGVHKKLVKHLPEETLPPIQAALVFTNPKAVIEISEEDAPPAETVSLDKLKDAIRKAARGKVLSMDKASLIQEALEAS